MKLDDILQRDVIGEVMNCNKYRRKDCFDRDLLPMRLNSSEELNYCLQ
jgi:hypothetical protein